MAGRKTAVYVTTPDETGRMVTYPTGSELSADVAKGIDNPKVWGEDESKDESKPAAKKTASKSSSSK